MILFSVHQALPVLGLYIHTLYHRTLYCPPLGVDGVHVLTLMILSFPM